MLGGKVRAVSAILVAVLAGHPVVTTLCDLVCSSLPYETALKHKAAGDHSPTSHDPALVADRHGGRLESGQHQHRTTALEHRTTALEKDGEFTGHAQVLRPSEDCCSDPAVLQASAVASRGDTSLIPTLQPGVLDPAIVLNRLDRHEQSSPPEVILAVSSPARTPLVLRI